MAVTECYLFTLYAREPGQGTVETSTTVRLCAPVAAADGGSVDVPAYRASSNRAGD